MRSIVFLMVVLICAGLGVACFSDLLVGRVGYNPFTGQGPCGSRPTDLGRIDRQRPNVYAMQSPFRLGNSIAGATCGGFFGIFPGYFAYLLVGKSPRLRAQIPEAGKTQVNKDQGTGYHVNSGTGSAILPKSFFKLTLVAFVLLAIYFCGLAALGTSGPTRYRNVSNAARPHPSRTNEDKGENP